MAQVKTLLKEALVFLEKAKVADYKNSAEEILAFFLGVKKNELFLHLEEKLSISKEEKKKLFQALERRSAKEPLQYILGSVPFYNVELKVSPSVLIPRPETEYLVDLIVKKIKINKKLRKESSDLADQHLKDTRYLKAKNKDKNQVLWDLGTGSGALAIALKQALPELTVIASDISKKALTVAKENAALNGVKVEFRLGDLFEPFEGEKADFIVSNPPYVSEAEYPDLAEELFYEPKEALIGGRDGLAPYRRIAVDFKRFLRVGGQLFLEMGESQGAEIQKIFLKADY